MRRVSLTMWVLVAGVVAVGQTALAQPAPPSDPRISSPAGLGATYSGAIRAGTGLPSTAPRYGIRLGDFVLQPRFFLQGSYTSNFFRVDTRNANVQEEAVLALDIRPGLAIFNPNYDLVAMKMSVDADVRVPFSDNQAVKDQLGVGIDADASLLILPKRAFTIGLFEHFDRQLWTRAIATSSNADRNRNSVGADLSLHPGGRALDITAGYRWEIERFDDLNLLDTDEHVVSLLASWRFYPQTYVFLDTAMRLSEYATPRPVGDDTEVGNYVPGKPVRAALGLSGYISERVAMLVKAGYGNSLLDPGAENFSNFIGRLQASFRFSARSVLHVGAIRDFDLVAFGGQYAYVRGFVSFEQSIRDRVLVHLDFSIDHRRFGRWVPALLANPADPDTTIRPGTSDAHRKDLILAAGLLVDIDITRLFGLTLGYRFSSNLTDFATTLPSGQIFQGYNEHRAFATLNLRY
ncbi:MAG: hypothetical protein H6744_02545 [Deltaproteobacteria bacterium]|nr:hypothetical protein [Deltaproteobacteria bacterium]MCB9785551.1 hypothetical protein [Deltaproteobacteria bacterium]